MESPTCASPAQIGSTSWSRPPTLNSGPAPDAVSKSSASAMTEEQTHEAIIDPEDTPTSALRAARHHRMQRTVINSYRSYNPSSCVNPQNHHYCRHPQADDIRDDYAVSDVGWVVVIRYHSFGWHTDVYNVRCVGHSVLRARFEADLKAELSFVARCTFRSDGL